MVSSTSVFHFWNLNIFVLFLGWSSGNSEYFLSSINPFYLWFLMVSSGVRAYAFLVSYRRSKEIINQKYHILLTESI
jgi:hypothetical protein